MPEPTPAPTVAATPYPTVDDTYSPSIRLDSDSPTYGGTMTVGSSVSLPPTETLGDDGYIYTTQVEDEPNNNDEEEHVPNWHPYTPLTPEQYAQCQSDLVSSDINNDNRLDYKEYLNFLSLNGNYGGYYSSTTNKSSLKEYPYEFSIIFHTTACQCSYLGEGEGCCLGDREGVRIFIGDAPAVNENRSAAGGTTTTIDVGGAENNQSTEDAPITPFDYFDDFYWSELPSHIQQAYMILGYDEASWDEGYPVPESETMAWDDLSLEMQQAAMVLGYGQESWDGGRRFKRRMEKIMFTSAGDIFGDLRIVDEDGDEEEMQSDASGGGGVSILMDPETYTRNFCTDGE